MITLRLREFAIVDLLGLGWKPGSIMAALLCTRAEISAALHKSRRMGVEASMCPTVFSMLDSGFFDYEIAALFGVSADRIFTLRVERLA